jgi:hypothetical protein
MNDTVVLGALSLLFFNQKVLFGLVWPPDLISLPARLENIESNFDSTTRSKDIGSNFIARSNVFGSGWVARPTFVRLNDIESGFSVTPNFLGCQT